MFDPERFERELFDSTDEERTFIAELRAYFLDSRLKPISNEDIYSNKFSEDAYRRAFKAAQEAGICGFNIPQEYGGLGLSSKLAAMLIEEMCAVDGGIGLSIGASSSLVAVPVMLFGTQEQKRRWLPLIAKGEVIGCYCQTESDAGSDVASIKTRAVQREDGVWVINGEKQFITNGAYAHLAVVVARTSTFEGNPHKGISVFLVDLERAKKQGQFSVLREAERKAGLHASPTSAVAFIDCTADDVLGSIDEGWKILMATLASSRATAIGSQGVGIAKGAWRIADAYARQRVQFKQPLSNFPDVQWEMLSVESAIDAAHLLVIRSALLRDYFSQSDPRDSRPWQMEASVTKLYGSELASEATSSAMQVLGGFGYMMESGVPKFWHDGRVVSIYEGTSGVQRLVIGREIIARALKHFSSKSEFVRWKLTKKWVLSNHDEENAFWGRMNYVGKDERVMLKEFMLIRKRFIGCFQEVLSHNSPKRDSSSLPLAWRFIVEAFVACEAAKMLLWQLVYHRERHPHAAPFRAHASWGVYRAKVAVFALKAARDCDSELEAACGFVGSD